LALLSVVRAAAHLLLLWTWRGQPRPLALQAV